MSSKEPNIATTHPSAATPLFAGWRELLLLFLLAAIWSSSFMLIKVGVETIPPMTVAAGRLILAAAMLTLFAAFGGYRLPTSLPVWGVCFFIGFFGNALPFTLIGWGELRIDSGLAAILMGIVPIATAVLAHAFTRDEPLRLGRLVGILIGFTGLLVLVGWQSLAGLRQEVFSQLAVLLGALCYAVTNIFARRYIDLPGRVLAAGATTAGALLIVPMSLAYEQPWELNPSIESVGAVIVLGVLPTGIATLIYFRLIKAVGATILSQVNYLVPIMGVVWGVALLGERPEWQALLALALVLAGIALVNRRGLIVRT